MPNGTFSIERFKCSIRLCRTIQVYDGLCETPEKKYILATVFECPKCKRQRVQVWDKTRRRKWERGEE